MVAARAAQLALLALSGLLSLALAEGVLRVFTPFPVTPDSNRTPHPRLGYVVAGTIPGVDADGFRNPALTLEEADTVVVGDSHTYGYNVTPEGSFPALLARTTGRRIYNMGIPSYGIYHYQVLLEDLAARPLRNVILALYPANDLVLHSSITGLPYWREYSRSAGLGAHDGQVEAKAARPGLGVRSLPSFAWNWLKTHSAVFNAYYSLVWKRIRPEPSFRFPHGQLVSVRRVQKHARSTELDDPVNLRIFGDSLSIIANASRRFGEAQIRFGVVVIPSRERVLFEWARAQGHPVDPEFEALVAKERQLTQAYADFLREEGIAYVDAINPMIAGLEEEIRSGGRLYPDHDDAHPYARGYEAYATAAAELLEPGTP